MTATWWRIPALVLTLALLLGACQPGGSGSSGASGSLPRQAGGTFAHEHTITAEADEAAIPAAHQAVIDVCASGTDFSCSVLGADLSTGRGVRATLDLRVEPAGVPIIRSTVADVAEITRQTTQVDDLAEAIADTEARVAMLTSQRDRLLELEASAANDVDALIKIAAELAKIQSELERLAGQAASQKLRVETDVLKIRFTAERTASFWRPIGNAFGDFAQDLSFGISDAIGGLALILPWFVVLLPFFLILRWLWRRRRTRRRPRPPPPATTTTEESTS